MLKASGLDWEVRQHECFAEINCEKVPVGRSALVRETDNKILTITGPDWKPLQNRQALEFFRDYTEAGGATLETAGSLRGGKIVWGLARVAAGFTINRTDHVKGYILLVSPHEVGKSITVRTTSVRVVCANTLALAGGVRGANSEYRQSHVKDFDVAAAKATVQLVKEQIAAMKLEAQALQSLRMSEHDTVRFLASFFQPAESAQADTKDRVDALINNPDLQTVSLKGALWATAKAPGATPGNGWGVLNGVTYWADHMAGRNADTRLFNSWLGDNAKKKESVKRKLLEMAS
jgi:phage/plasmid-like protein (TIGR03299 family)